MFSGITDCNVRIQRKANHRTNGSCPSAVPVFSPGENHVKGRQRNRESPKPPVIQHGPVKWDAQQPDGHAVSGRCKVRAPGILPGRATKKALAAANEPTAMCFCSSANEHRTLNSM